MKDRFVTPKTYFMSYTEINEPELIRYLRETDQMEFLQAYDQAREDDKLSSAEILCSFFAKLCYKSLAPRKNLNLTKTRNVWDNIVATFDSGHGAVFEHVNFGFVVSNCSRVYCYCEDTEVFTADGWKAIAEITKQDELMTMNPTTGQAQWSKPLSVHRFDWDTTKQGKLFGWRNSQMTSPAVTPEHLLWAAPYDVRRARGLSNAEIAAKQSSKIAADALYGCRFVIDHGVRMAVEADPDTIDISGHGYDAADLFSWLGWMATDGTFSKDRSNQSTINQSKETNLPEIRALMDRLFADQWREHGPYEGSEQLYFTVSNASVTTWAKDMIGPNKLQRKLDSVIFTYSPRLLRCFYASVLRGDGSVHKGNKHEVIYTPSKTAAGQYQVLAARLGYCANVREDARVGAAHEVNGVEVRHTRPTYIVSVSRKTASMVRVKHQVHEDYQGPVYCPKTKDGLIYVRFRGLPFWCGNTHEQVRHRIAAYSQTSGRYVRLEHIPIVLDPVLDDCQDILAQALQQIEDAVYLLECRKGLRVPPPIVSNDTSDRRRPEYYLKLRETSFDHAEFYRWVPNDRLPFHEKKKLTSAIRRIAPNGIANELGFTVNLRTLRHQMMVRTAAAAEWEIRLIFNQIHDLLASKYPLIFYGEKKKFVDGAWEYTGYKVQPYEKEAMDVLGLMTDEEILGYLDNRRLAS